MEDNDLSMLVGDVIRELREARGWSQSRLADELCAVSGTNITREYISRRWESNTNFPSPFWLAHLAAVLDVPLSLFEGDMDRRLFLASAAATAVAPVVAADLLAEGFTSRLRGAGPRVVEEWEHKLESYGRDYMSLGASEIQKRLASDLVILQQQLDNPRMWSIAARLMVLYAKTFGGNDGSKAVTWYRMASDAADRSGDPETRVWVRGRAAIALGYEAAALPVAEIFADEAAELSDKPSLGRLNAVMGAAHVAAIRGDAKRALNLTDDGRRIFDVVASDEQTSDYAVPWWRFNVFTSLLAARIGDEETAVKAQEAAQAELPPALPRFATHLQMHKGLMLVRAGDTDEGTRLARDALNALPPAKHSLTLRMLMDEIATGQVASGSQKPHGTTTSPRVRR
jgi:transcriptional regulator with XRE-family HTH domain